ncbi:hypothetical protein O181_016774 [Austropuccinia psidii MF-1]|uniref:Uncharacterized protein n=1 Tax=Austropuccinia psidii MF-1 TaxID=1389203 RepID=A0A9Q3C2C4_9BASI|nr:hypothetical protein [Austropuccinia psidii MF-1]
MPIPQPNNSTSTVLHQGHIARFNHTAYSQLIRKYQSPELQPSPIPPFDIIDPYKPSTWNEYSPFNHTNQKIQRGQDIGGSSHVFVSCIVQKAAFLIPPNYRDFQLVKIPCHFPNPHNQPRTSFHLLGICEPMREVAKGRLITRSGRIIAHQYPIPFHLGKQPFLPPTDFRGERPHQFFQQSPPENPKSSTISTFRSQSANTTLRDFSSTTTCSLGQKTPPVPHCGFLYHRPPGQHI